MIHLLNAYLKQQLQASSLTRAASVILLRLMFLASWIEQLVSLALHSAEQPLWGFSDCQSNKFSLH